ncbi:hypothetical protein CSB11_01040 [Candidatus Campbellbacteria bacterium]|nr:MAG: hypothetical protein CSB11_01040 [Candidatus Campbellbacteria bacterium]
MRSLKNFLTLSFLAVTAFGLTGCGKVVEIPPAHVGKLSTPNGLQEGVIPPSKIRLSNLCITCDSIILAEASDYPISDSLKIYMPKDELNLDVDVRGTVTISAEKSNIDQVFDRVTAQPTQSERVNIIPLSSVYKIYAEPVIREVVRSSLTRYTISQVMGDRAKVSDELMKEIRRKLSSTPITVKQLGLADVQPPEVIIKAREAAKEREIAIQRAEADKQVKLKEAEAALEVAKKQQQVDLKEAETQVLVNKKLAEGVNQAFVTQRWLKVMDQMSQNTEGKVIILPFEAIKNPAILTGVSNKALKGVK